MAKLTLTFDLPEERDESLRAVHGGAAFAALYDLDQVLRNKIKYNELSDDEERGVQFARDQLRELCADFSDVLWGA